MNPSSKGTALITGASSGIGAVYADRLARRGHDLILVARNRERLDAPATRLTDETGCSVTVIVAGLNNKADLARVEQVHRTLERRYSLPQQDGRPPEGDTLNRTAFHDIVDSACGRLSAVEQGETRNRTRI